MIIGITGALLDDRTTTDESGIFRFLYIFAFLTILFTIGWSYRSLYRRSTRIPGCGDNLEAEQDETRNPH